MQMEFDKMLDEEGHIVDYDPNHKSNKGREEESTNPKLDDDSPFPFGKWKGYRCEDVPENYLRWLLGQDWVDSWPLVIDYCDRCGIE